MRPFRDRVDAGRQLGAQLRQTSWPAEPIVLGLPRGGVPVAAEVARALDARLDVLVVRKLGVPGQPELTMGAVAGLGDSVSTVRNESVIHATRVSRPTFEAVCDRELVELRRRQLALGTGRPGTITGQTVVLVDDGLATGATMSAAVAAIRQHRPAQVVVAVPVGAERACADLRSEADRLVCLQRPKPFVAVSVVYRDFHQTADHEVVDILARERARYASRGAAAADIPRPFPENRPPVDPTG